MNKKYKETDFKYMINHYSDMSSTKIAKKIGCSRSLVLKTWIENNLKGKEIGRQYYFNFNYFSKINTPNKAYLIGLLAADGNLFKRNGHQGQVQITLNKQDKDILEKIKIEINYIEKPLLEKDNQLTLTFNSDVFYQDLIKIGLYDKKTYTIDFNNILIPSKFKFDYIRGYFDGDGSIFISKPKTNKNITPCCYSISIVGFQKNIESIQIFLKEKNIKSTLITDKRKYSKPFASLNVHSIRDKYFFLKNIYKNSTLRMNRKYKKAKNFFQQVEKNKKYQNIINEYAVYAQNLQKDIDY